MIAGTTLAGSRGAITFAGILTLPIALSTGEAFAERDLAILIAMGVIVLSLVIAAIGLPIVLRHGAVLPAQVGLEEIAAKTAAATAALAEISRIGSLHTTPDKESESYGHAAALVSRQYLHRLDTIGHHSGGEPAVHPHTRARRELQLAAVRAERRSVFLMRRKKAIGATLARRLVRELDLLEAHFET
jgi:CPA1 family monovalent cation:H+ antiporter